MENLKCMKAFFSEIAGREILDNWKKFPLEAAVSIKCINFGPQQYYSLCRI